MIAFVACGSFMTASMMSLASPLSAGQTPPACRLNEDNRQTAAPAVPERGICSRSGANVERRLVPCGPAPEPVRGESRRRLRARADAAAPEPVGELERPRGDDLRQVLRPLRREHDERLRRR